MLALFKSTIKAGKTVEAALHGNACNIQIGVYQKQLCGLDTALRQIFPKCFTGTFLKNSAKMKLREAGCLGNIL